MKPNEDTPGRGALESLIAADLRELTAESEQIGQRFAGSQDVRANDFRALLHIMVAETAGKPISPGELGQRMGLSGAGTTYLVDRLIESGHVRREAHESDRRKVVLRYAQRGLDTASAFFTPLHNHTHRAMAKLSDSDLETAHEVFGALIAAMRDFRAELDLT
ncbi:MarR family transcriptional regulator [Mycolicibacter sp. MYC123]|uniref:MarR family transcriptional regulator n=1 Tax=[Mycobacterium] zoologicum TaxID=2872311 RepID=A0ABU5YJW4_9MYCO|nr:MarR family transcriptional regulator [Mycolicibacter sp. MYC123]MEB3050328.1 MarR family transcriptional regulator [Mycolicibacter sp. MYC123]